jgi:hypothetical protein
MNKSFHELTVTNLLADPMVRTLMAADRVNVDELAAMLAAMAETLQPPRPGSSAHAPQLAYAN